jgi:hypothetical protein
MDEQLLKIRERALSTAKSSSLYGILCKKIYIADPMMVVVVRPRRSEVSSSIAQWVLERVSGFDTPSTPTSCVLVMSQNEIPKSLLGRTSTDYILYVSGCRYAENDEEKAAGVPTVTLVFKTGAELKIYEHEYVDPMRDMANKDLVCVDDMWMFFSDRYSETLKQITLIFKDIHLRPTQAIVASTGSMEEEYHYLKDLALNIERSAFIDGTRMLFKT